MLEKFGVFKDGNEIKVIYKDDNGYIDVSFVEKDKTDVIVVPSYYDIECKNEISVNDVCYIIKKCFGYVMLTNGERFNNDKKVEIFVRNTNGNYSDTWLKMLRDKSKFLEDFGYKQIFVLNGLPGFLGGNLDNLFVHKVLHGNDYNNGEKLNFLKWVKKYKLEEKQRQDYISWEEYFMAVSKLSAMRSKDPSTQVGACIVSEDNRLLSVGYNGAPRGYKDYKFPWNREGGNLDTKYFFVVHAEKNAILNYGGSRQDFKGASIYVDLFPCNECAKEIIQVGIKEVIYLSDKYADTDSVIASKILFDECGVKYRQLDEEYRKVLTLDLRK